VRRPVMFVATAAALLFAAQSAVAQTAPALPKMPLWDTNFSLGMITNSARDEGDDADRSSIHAEARFDVGHYWTQHLKTEAGVSFLNRWDEFDFEIIPVPGSRGGGYSYTTRTMRMTTITPTFTYQFLENQFVHPYLSAGARIGLLETHFARLPQIFTQEGVTYGVTAIDRTETTILVRPVVAAGCKSYFNERVFVRPEGQALFDRRGNPFVSLRVGVGIDF
jgi:hypothetical protein